MVMRNSARNAVLVLPYLIIALLAVDILHDQGGAYASTTVSNPTRATLPTTRLCGLYRGVVQSTDDPEHLNRVRLGVPQANVSAVWALAGLKSAPLPAVGTEVWVMFETGDVNYPVWFGAPPGA